MKTGSKKALIDFTVIENRKLSAMYSLLVLEDTSSSFDFASIAPGQFVEVRIDETPSTMLRRPISVHFVDVAHRTLYLLVRNAGDGTNWLCNIPEGSVVNVMLPLGNGFSIPDKDGCIEGTQIRRPLLVGGGVGVAPLLFLGKFLRDKGIVPTFLLAAKTEKDLLLVDRFKEFGDVEISTDDGSAGATGLVTLNPCLKDQWDYIYVCGPKPMMVGIAKIAKENGIECEVSLENTMACGLGACLCCVEDTDKGNVCVCTDGPVFNTRKLKWEL